MSYSLFTPDEWVILGFAILLALICAVIFND